VSKPQQASEPKARRPQLRCVPTHVVLQADDAEYASAWTRLAQGLCEAGLFGHGDARQANGGHEWRYLCSIPRREATTIVYFHVYGHGHHPATGSSLTCAVAATEGWWPTRQPSVRLERTWPRARLHLVS
jgi:hypothetical protein